MVQIRNLIRRNKVSAEEIREYCNKHRATYAEAQKRLLDETHTLQYRFNRGEWIDVPTVVEFREDHHA